MTEGRKSQNNSNKTAGTSNNSNANNANDLWSSFSLSGPQQQNNEQNDYGNQQKGTYQKTQNQSRRNTNQNGFQTDVQISATQNQNRRQERTLQKFDFSSSGANTGNLQKLQSNTWRRNADSEAFSSLHDDDPNEKFDQFKGKKSTYDESLYTSKLDESQLTKEQKVYAKKIEKDILTQPAEGNRHLAEERNQMELSDDEEDEMMYSGVIRDEQSYNSKINQSQGKAGRQTSQLQTPVTMNAQSQPFVPGGKRQNSSNKKKASLVKGQAENDQKSNLDHINQLLMPWKGDRELKKEIMSQTHALSDNSTFHKSTSNNNLGSIQSSSNPIKQSQILNQHQQTPTQNQQSQQQHQQTQEQKPTTNEQPITNQLAATTSNGSQALNTSASIFIPKSKAIAADQSNNTAQVNSQQTIDNSNQNTTTINNQSTFQPTQVNLSSQINLQQNSQALNVQQNIVSQQPLQQQTKITEYIPQRKAFQQQQVVQQQYNPMNNQQMMQQPPSQGFMPNQNMGQQNRMGGSQPFYPSNQTMYSAPYVGAYQQQSFPQPIQNNQLPNNFGANQNPMMNPLAYGNTGLAGMPQSSSFTNLDQQNTQLSGGNSFALGATVSNNSATSDQSKNLNIEAQPFTKPKK
ncbi:UNKNOWN [Stylonychia lemnae]|uniref:LsmAD domain-containing protein n=1 Tax=Stylonychia lemnae TaxID=5949 RepID=A0A078AFJ4_STYLE|nr:UNKNOWN [Stylonychia lemnae]|eukprot:CDW80975.1 UNKNOWN [Stylonychia lemnae]